MWQQIQRDIVSQNRNFGGYPLTNIQAFNGKDIVTDLNWDCSSESLPVVNQELKSLGTGRSNPLKSVAIDQKLEEISSDDYRHSRLTPYLYGTKTSNFQDSVGDSSVSDRKQQVWLIEPKDVRYGDQSGRFLPKASSYNIPVKIDAHVKKTSNLYKKRFDKSLKRYDTSIPSTGHTTYFSTDKVTLPKHQYVSNTTFKDKSQGINKRIPSIGGTISKNVFGTSGTYTLNCNVMRPTCVDSASKRKCIYEKGNGSGIGKEMRTHQGFLNPQSRLNTPIVNVVDGDNVSESGSMLW